MLKRFFKSAFGRFLCASIAYLYIRLVYYTSHWRFIGLDVMDQKALRGEPFIVCFWHSRLFMLCCAWRVKKPFYMMISAHSDGQLISKVMDFAGISTIQGSTNRSGAGALKMFLSCLKEGHAVGITPDGPRGPRETLTDGILQAAYLGQVPILPLCYDVRHKKVLNTWDRFIIPRPFTSGVFVLGHPVDPPSNKLSFETVRSELSVEMKRIQDLAQEALYDS